MYNNDEILTVDSPRETNPNMEAVSSITNKVKILGDKLAFISTDRTDKKAEDDRRLSPLMEKLNDLDKMIDEITNNLIV